MDFGQTIYGVHLTNLVIAIGLMVFALLAVGPLCRLLAKLLSSRYVTVSGKRYPTLFTSLVARPLAFFLQVVTTYIALNLVKPFFMEVLFRRKIFGENFSLRSIDLIDHLAFLLIIFSLASLLSRTTTFYFRLNLDRARIHKDKNKIQILPLVKTLIKFLVWATAIFLILGIVFHVNIPALITGLGIGGIAIALAGKESLENLFASFTILLDKPFEAGDTIRVGNFEGIIEYIGFRSTRMRNADGTVYILPNKKLVDESLENMSQRAQRKLSVSVHLKYGIGTAILNQIITDLKQKIKETVPVRDPVDIAIEHFGEQYIRLTATYFIDEPLKDKTLVALKQEINVAAYGVLEKYVDLKEYSLSTEVDKPTA